MNGKMSDVFGSENIYRTIATTMNAIYEPMPPVAASRNGVYAAVSTVALWYYKL